MRPDVSDVTRRDLPASPSEPLAAAWKDHISRLSRLVRKELAEILRDRRTIITLVLMPVLVYPLLAIIFQQLSQASLLASQKQPVYRIGFRSMEEYRLFDRQFQVGEKIYRERNPEQIGKSPMSLEYFESTNLDQDVEEGRIQLGMELLPVRRVGQDQVVIFKVIYRENLGAAQEVLQYLERRLAASNDYGLRSRLGVPKRPPVQLFRLSLSPQPYQAPPRVSLGALIPLILILMTITGAVYPAIDLTAGERERGTLEILVAAPVPRMGLLFAKYVTVLTIAVLTALVNLFTMLMTLAFSPMGSAILSSGELTFPLIMQMLGLLVLLATFFAAVLLAITSAARSFKEAQAYLIPLMLLSLTPGVLGMLPGLELEGLLLVTPLVNIVLLARDMFEGHASAAVSIVVVISTLLYALAAISVAARIFGAESVLFSEQRNWSDLWHRPHEPSDVPSLTNAFLCMAFVLPAFFVLQGLLRQLIGDYRNLRESRTALLILLLSMPVASAVLFGGFPSISAWWNRVVFESGFQLRRPRLAALLGGALLGISLWPAVIQLLATLTPLLAPERLHLEGILRVVRQAQQDYLAVWVTAVFVQAIAEEWFFRGFLFSALRARGGPWLTIGASAFLFGFFHLVAGGGLHFVSSTILGIVLGWVAWQSRSVIPGMLFHAIHNSVLASIVTTELPWSWVTVGGAASLLAILLIKFWGGQPSRPHALSEELVYTN